MRCWVAVRAKDQPEWGMRFGSRKYRLRIKRFNAMLYWFDMLRGILGRRHLSKKLHQSGARLDLRDGKRLFEFGNLRDASVIYRLGPNGDQVLLYRRQREVLL
jgi:hypothetical protein